MSRLFPTLPQRPLSPQGVARQQNDFTRGPLAVALALLLALSHLLLSLPAAAQTAPPFIGLAPTSGVPGKQITINGGNFFPGGYPGLVLWDGATVKSITIPQGGVISATLTIPADAPLGQHTVTVCAAQGDLGCTTGEFDQRASANFTVEQPFAGLSGELRRRAIQFLEEMRNSEMAEGWKQGRIGEVARPLFRPDIEGPAYYEVQIFAPSQKIQTAAVAQPSSAAGFIILSNGEHDFPIAHWNDRGQSPTELLRIQALRQQAQAARFFKLDALSYAAEDEKGNKVGQLGSELTKVSGVGLDQLDKPQQLSAAVHTGGASQDDANATEGGKLETSGPGKPAAMTLGGWGSWDELKSGYAAAYAPFIEDLRRQAKHDWDIEKSARQIGEGLRKGDVYNLALLEQAGALAATLQVSLSGPGAALVTGELETPAGQAANYRITVINDVVGQGTPFAANITYSDGTTETAKFVVIGAAPTQGQIRVFLPSVVKGGAQVAGAADSAPRTQGAWGPWTYFWAGGHGDQRLYDQIPAGSSPNTSGCWSGCGATSWAMLFGWADNQAAAGNPAWAARWGLYRQNGGRGANAVAPQFMDAGVRAMTWEIRGQVGTFCAFGSGATAPWDMGGAWRYLDGRTGTTLRTNYNVFGIHSDDLREKARDSIRLRGTPAIIGTGWLSHYPLAYGYAWRSRETRSCFGPDLGFNCWTSTEYARFFYVNQGWGGDDNGWVSAGTWFAGEIRP